jgi:hypothetical protein
MIKLLRENELEYQKVKKGDVYDFMLLSAKS